MVYQKNTTNITELLLESMELPIPCFICLSGYAINAWKCEVPAIEPMLEESGATYTYAFNKLKKRRLNGVQLVISDVHSGLVKAIAESFPGTGWQHCKVHFVRNILAHVVHRDKDAFAPCLN